MVKVFTLPYGITVSCAENQSASIVSNLRAEFLIADRPPQEFSAEERAAEGFIDGIESLLLALASEGVDLAQPAISNAVETAVEAFANHCD
jgi:hypothetical protein